MSQRASLRLSASSAVAASVWSAQQGLRRAALDSLKRLVERHLDSPELSAGFICERSGWSRATVYRLFETEGGLARYIRQRRLLGAFRELMLGRQPRRRILDLAMDCQFASEATFSRAFHRMFGIPPSEVRELARPCRATCGSSPPSPRARMMKNRLASSLRFTMASPR